MWRARGKPEAREMDVTGGLFTAVPVERNPGPAALQERVSGRLEFDRKHVHYRRAIPERPLAAPRLAARLVLRHADRLRLSAGLALRDRGPQPPAPHFDGAFVSSIYRAAVRVRDCGR